MKKTIFSLILSVLAISFVVPAVTSAQSVSSSSCVSISNNLYVGSSDYATNGEVTRLQAFLQSQGYFNVQPTGYYGGRTYAAVVKFQVTHGIRGTGYVGLLTRNAISHNCGNPVPPPQAGVQIMSLSSTYGTVGTQVTIYGTGFTADNTINFGYGAIVHAAAINNGTQLTFNVPSYLNPACYYSIPNCLPPTRQTVPGSYDVSVSNSNGVSGTLSFIVTGSSSTQSPVISTVSPSAGAVGTEITIYGSGFTSTNNRVQFGAGTISNINSYDGNTLKFTVPSYLSPYCPSGSMCPMYVISMQPGPYTLSVINPNGTSNSLQFIVTSGTSGQAPTISQTSGPTNLSVGQQATWTIQAYDPANGSLSYSVTWGDENTNPYAMSASQAQFTQTATFTHTYYRTGMYTPTFVVRNSQGLQAQTSLTVRVI